MTMVHKSAIEAQKRWRKLNGYEPIAKVIDGLRFKDGVEVVAEIRHLLPIHVVWVPCRKCLFCRPIFASCSCNAGGRVICRSSKRWRITRHGAAVCLNCRCRGRPQQEGGGGVGYPFWGIRRSGQATGWILMLRRTTWKGRSP
jgi:hypothetical protein